MFLINTIYRVLYQMATITKERFRGGMVSDRLDTVDSPIYEQTSQYVMPKKINPEDFVVWLTTQTNANGSSFLRNVAKRYARSLSSIPIKLDIPLSAEERNVFCHLRISEFDHIDRIFRTAPNYQEVNYSDHCSFSAGLGAYRRYLEYLNNQDGNNVGTEKVDVYVVNFTNTEACSRSNLISCFINGANIPFIGNWRDLLVAITEYCILEYADKTEMLKSEWFSSYSNTPYLLSNKPPRSGRKLSNGYWINVHYSISNIVSIIAGICRYCGINLNNIEITYSPKTNGSLDDEPASVAQPTTALLDSIISVLTRDYPNGFCFNTTSIRLLIEKSSIDIDNSIQNALKKLMFCRNDSVCFLRDVVVDSETQKKIIDTADKWLDAYGCFESSMLYAIFIGSMNEKAIRNVDDFVAFYEHINRRNVRCITHYGTRIARVQDKNIRDLILNVAAKIISIIHDEFGGVVSEDDLNMRFSAFSVDLLGKIIKEYAEELVKTEINGIVCYQTLDALGLSDEFSNTLAGVLEQLDELRLPPSEEVLHTALSIRLGVNFRTEYNITDDKTYRRLITVYYKERPKRDWRRGVFAEVQD